MDIRYSQCGHESVLVAYQQRPTSDDRNVLHCGVLTSVVKLQRRYSIFKLNLIFEIPADALLVTTTGRLMNVPRPRVTRLQSGRSVSIPGRKCLTATQRWYGACRSSITPALFDSLDRYAGVIMTHPGLSDESGRRSAITLRTRGREMRVMTSRRDARIEGYKSRDVLRLFSG